MSLFIELLKKFFKKGDIYTPRKTHIIFGTSYEDCMLKCMQFKLRRVNCVFHFGKDCDNKLRGYYGAVKDDKVEVIGVSKEYFLDYYTRM